MKIRVIQWGTGNVGKHSLRAIIERPDLELAALKVYRADKVGKDAGVIVGGEPVGVLATDKVEHILATSADCVVYNSLGMTLGSIDAAIDDICMLLENGFNVISSAVEQAVYPRALPREVLARLEQACAAGQSRFLATGINPGFSMDLWPIQMTRLSRQIRQVRTLEVCNMRDYGSPNIMAYMGFGRTVADMGERDTVSDEPEDTPFHASMLMVADALRFELDGFRSEHEYAVTPRDIAVATGTIAAGRIAVVKMRYVGQSRGKDVLVNEWVWRVTEDLNPEWGTGEFWSLEIKGDPDIKSRVEATTQHDSKRIVSLTVATTAVNSIVPLCATSPGVKSAMDLMPCGGGTVVT